LEATAEKAKHFGFFREKLWDYSYLQILIRMQGQWWPVNKNALPSGVSMHVDKTDNVIGLSDRTKTLA